MTPFEAIDLINFEDEDTPEEKIAEAWQYLHDSRLAYQLEGWYGRTCQRLILEGLINP